MANKDAQQLDFTKVKDGGGAFRKTRQQAGDYRGKITKVETVDKKGDDGKKQWLFTIKVGAGIYPYYCGFEENVLWKIRNLFIAAGVNVPKKRVTVDPAKVVNKSVGITLEDDEYDGKKQSSIASVFPTTELDPDDNESDDDEDNDTDDTSKDTDDEAEEEAKPSKKEKKKKDKSEKAAGAEEAPAKKKKKSKKSEMQELDIDDI